MRLFKNGKTKAESLLIISHSFLVLTAWYVMKIPLHYSLLTLFFCRTICRIYGTPALAELSVPYHLLPVLRPVLNVSQFPPLPRHLLLMAATAAMIVQAAIVPRVDSAKWQKCQRLLVWTSTRMTKKPIRRILSTMKSCERSAQRKCSPPVVHVTIYAVIPIYTFILNLHLRGCTWFIYFISSCKIYIYFQLSRDLELGRNYTHSILFEQCGD